MNNTATSEASRRENSCLNVSTLETLDGNKAHEIMPTREHFDPRVYSQPRPDIRQSHDSSHLSGNITTARNLYNPRLLNIQKSLESKITRNPNFVVFSYKRETLTAKELLDACSLVNAFSDRYLIDPGTEEIKIPDNINKLLMIKIIIGCTYSGIPFEVVPHEDLEGIHGIGAVANQETGDTRATLQETLFDEHCTTTKASKDVDRSISPFGVYSTSGTTSAPKRVLTNQVAVNNRLNWMQAEGSTDGAILVSKPFSKVGSIREILGPIVYDMKGVLIDREDLLNPENLFEVLKNGRVTRFDTFPKQLEALVSYIKEQKFPQEQLPPLKTVTLSGESSQQTLANDFLDLFKNATLYNSYGATETTSNTLSYRAHMKDKAHSQGSLPSGRPICYTGIVILDKQGKVVDRVNVEGDLFICGDMLFSKYINDKEKTNAAKLTINGEVFYKTGDKAKFIQESDETILLVTGRDDDLIQINGNNVNLNNVSDTIRSIDGVRNCTAKYFGSEKETLKRKLVVFIESDRDDLTPPALNSRIEEYYKNSGLRSYIPNGIRFRLIEKTPVLRSGKTDKRSLLPNLGKLITSNSDIQVGCLQEQQSKIISIIQEHTGYTDINATSLLGDCGIDSFQAMVLSHTVSKELGVKLTLLTSLSINDVLTKISNDPSVFIRVNSSPKLSDKKIFSFPGLTGNTDGYRLLSESGEFNYYCLDYLGDTNPDDSTIEKIMLEILNTNEIGSKVNLMGWSAGGVIASLVAQKLEIRGIEYKLVLIDSTLNYDIPESEEKEFLHKTYESCYTFHSDELLQKMTDYYSYIKKCYAMMCGPGLTKINATLVKANQGSLVNGQRKFPENIFRSLNFEEANGTHFNILTNHGLIDENRVVIEGCYV